MPIALLTTYLAPYRVPLFERLARATRRRGPVLRRRRTVRALRGSPTSTVSSGGAVPRPAPERRRRGARARTPVRHGDRGVRGRRDAARRVRRRDVRRRPFVLWASVWAQPRSLAHALALPATRHIYRHADAVVAYGEHVRRFVASMRGRDDDVFIAPQSVEPELFGREVSADEVDGFRSRHGIGAGPIVLYAGRLVPEKGIPVLLDAWRAGPRRGHARLDRRRAAGAPRRRDGGVRAARPDPPRRAARRLRHRRARRPALGSHAPLPRAVGARLQRGDAPGAAGGRDRRRGRGRRRAGPRRRDRAGRAAGRSRRRWRGAIDLLLGDDAVARADSARPRATRRRAVHLRGDGGGFERALRRRSLRPALARRGEPGY